MGFSTQVIIDIDEGETGWELVARHGPEDMIVAYSDIASEDIETTLGLIASEVALSVEALRSEPGASGNDDPDERHDYEA